MEASHAPQEMLFTEQFVMAVESSILGKQEISFQTDLPFIGNKAKSKLTMVAYMLTNIFVFVAITNTRYFPFTDHALKTSP